MVCSWGMLLSTVSITVAAIIAKGGACYAAARLCRVDHNESMAIGSLMNARGLMELILLNIALSAGLITATLFVMLTIMAIVTTLMTTPLFHIFYGRHLGDACHLRTCSMAIPTNLGPNTRSPIS